MFKQKNFLKVVVWGLVVIFGVCNGGVCNVWGTQSWAAQEFDYPELSVTPRASDRLEMEAAKAESQKWSTHLNLQVPAAMTFMSGLWIALNPTSKKFYYNSNGTGVNTTANYEGEYAQWAGLVVGSAWMAVTLGMNLFYQPYVSANKEISAMPKKSQREQLTRERLAEETIHSAGSLVRKLKWLSFFTNLGTNAYMASQTTNGSLAQILCGVSAAAAITPLLFSHPWAEISNAQGDYKKRIYAPVASAGFIPDYAAGSLAPGMSLSFFF